MTLDGKPFGKFFFIDDPDGYKIEVLGVAVSNNRRNAIHGGR